MARSTLANFQAADPPRPATRITRDDRVRMERAHVLAWPALRSARVRGWLWRSSGGGSQRANSVSTIDFHDVDPSAAIAEVESRYRSVRASPRFQTFDETSPPALADLLRARRYREADPTITMFKPATGATRGEDRQIPQTALPDMVETGDDPWPAWRALYLAGVTENRREANSHILGRITAPRRFFACRHDGRLVSTALCVIGFDCAVIECVTTRADYRRRGAAGAVLAALQDWAARQDVSWIGLQVAADNAPAIALYRSLGFVPGASNRFWIAPTSLD